MKLRTFFSFALTLTTSTIASVLPLERRQQSTEFRYTCNPTLASPTDFKAFNLGNCAAQLSFIKDRYISMRWAFDAVYADGSRVSHEPLRNFDTFGVSDPLYPYLGNNFITRFPGNSAFTAVQ